MDFLQFVLVVVLLAGVVWLVTAPLRRATAPDRPETADVAELEAAKEAKYREIRDAELDLRTGKLSEADYRELDQGLRAEAIEILNRLDAARAREPAGE